MPKPLGAFRPGKQSVVQHDTQSKRQRQAILALRHLWFIMHRAAKAPCRRRPISTTLGSTMPPNVGLGGPFTKRNDHAHDLREASLFGHSRTDVRGDSSVLDTWLAGS